MCDTVTTSWSADDICFLILNISCWSDILVLYVFSSTLPVLACYISNLECEILAPNIWQELFKMFQLHEIMRQRESKQFAEMLNRLREGNHSKEDIMKFKGRILQPSSTNYPTDAPHLFIQNAKVNEFNDRVPRAISGTWY